MTNSITIFPYQPFDIESGLTLFNFQNKNEFSQLIFRLHDLKKHATLTDDTNRILHFYTDSKNPFDENIKDVELIGDLNSFDINSATQLKIILKKVVANSTIIKDEIEGANSELNNLVFEAITQYSIPLSLDFYANFEKILKAKGVFVDTSKWQNYCDKLMDVTGFYSEFSNKKLLVFYDLERLLNLNQLNEIDSYLKSVDLTMVSLESYPMLLKEDGLNIKVYSIDNDHVRFDY
ncbi:type II-A CRISPR-associated protein Csn2 [Companilactobacillus huachuanensis]|uniref:Type II-A CRISPR-associated protein Csn2 n=1 Tax=Companilactobacillus huachuanensis TaxID=2559914 RepID=A0ABW1RLC2_9LACO|nr:type II-A CRISPR-associated protein Csn2 [Companilactobacillus huachuanensis]